MTPYSDATGEPTRAARGRAGLHGRLRRALRTTGTSEGDAVTNLELFFDLVYAFAFTQVTTLMSHERAPG